MRSLLAFDRGEASRFLLAGGINTAVGYGLYAFLLMVAGVHYRIALAAEYGVGIVVGFLLNRAFTWRFPQAHARRYLWKYALTYATTFTINFVILEVLVKMAGLHPLPGNALALGAVCVTSFLLQSHWVFKHRHALREALGGEERTPVT
jgi:putative flippase GtrA